MGQSINPYKLKIAGQISVFKLMDLCNIPDARKPASGVMVMSISFRLNSSWTSMPTMKALNIADISTDPRCIYHAVGT